MNTLWTKGFSLIFDVRARSVAFVITSALLMLSSASIHAQGSSKLEEVVVTAQKLEENLQEIPVSVTAITSDTLERRQILNIENIRYLVPNLYLEQNLSNSSTPRISLRGIGQANSAFSYDSPIGIYVDEVYYPRQIGALIDLFDIERVEALRGPQGTIYGRNSSIGAIRVITKDAPLDEVDFKAGITTGSEERIDGRFAAGIPLIEDKLGVRVAFLSKNHDGYQKNVTQDEDADTSSLNAFRGKILYKPNEDLSFTLRGDYLRDRSRPKFASHFLNDPDNDLLTFQSNRSYADGSHDSDLDSYGASLKIEWLLDNVTLTSITAWRGVDTTTKFDTDGTTAPSFEVDASFLDQNQVTQEIYATGSGTIGVPVDWIAGLFYFHEVNDYTWSLQIFAPPTVQLFDQTVDTVAPYFQSTFHLTDKWSLTGGFRYTHESKDFDALGLLADGSFDFSFSTSDRTLNKWTWRVATDYQLTDSVLLFASASTGFRSGGLNGNAQNLADVTGGAFGPEDTEMYEIGIKSDLFDNRLRFNATYFYGEYDDLQHAFVRDDGTVTNVGNSATVHGLELEATALLFEGFEVSGNVSTLDQNVKNSPNELPNAPDLKWDISATYTHRFLDVGTLELGGSYSWTDESFLGTDNNPILEVDSHENLDAHMTLALEGGHWEFTLAGHNLTDEIYPIGGFFIAGGFISAVKWPSTPRHWSLSASYTY